MNPRTPSLLFLGKSDDPDCMRALEFCRERFEPLSYCLGKWGDPLPLEIRSWEGDYIVSYLSRWVVPEELLQRARRAAINFHPASPDYPGIGCNNFALYEGANEYGVTCHHMARKVDTGRIIAVRRFPIYASDDVDALLKRTYEHQIALFFEIVGLMARGQELPVSEEVWTRAPFTRTQFDELFHITPEMSQDEVERRIRAVSYQHWQPYMELHGHRFEYRPNKK
ncbi:MAG: formyltransferase family protein [Anaerolineae bacterium]